MKPCIKCKHYKESGYSDLCYHPEVVKIDCVTGNIMPKHCRIAREVKLSKIGYDGPCYGGKLFEEREPFSLVSWLKTKISPLRQTLNKEPK